MKQMIFARLIQLAILLLVFFFSSGLLQAQTTQFTYQGHLTDSGSPANGAYDLQFKLYDAVAGGTQIGTTATLEDVTVTNGNFNVTLDFGAAAFPGANRWLEISVRPGASTGVFTALSPLQPLTATPYAIRSLNATTADGLSVACVNCVTSAQIASLPSGNGNYIQNTTTLQANADFNISGNGTAGGTLASNIVNATTQYNLNGSRILSNTGISNLFAGVAAGFSNTTGHYNAFFGPSAGFSNTTANSNAFFGSSAGVNNMTGGYNAFFGQGAGAANTAANHNAFFGNVAGLSNTTGYFNAFFGSLAGFSNTTACCNAFFGYAAGQSNTTGSSNSFFGQGAGTANTSANNNAFFGTSAGASNTTGYANAFFGSGAGTANTTGRENAFFGYMAGYSNTFSEQNSFFGTSAGSSNTSGHSNAFFGFWAGLSNTSGDSNAFFGYAAGQANTTGRYNAFFGYNAAHSNTTGFDNSFFGPSTGFSNTTGSLNTFFGAGAGSSNISGSSNTLIGFNVNVASGSLSYATAIGADAIVTTSNRIQLGRNGTDTVSIGTLAAASGTHLCINGTVLSSCSSSLRYKTNVATLQAGLGLIQRLRPVIFDWKNSNQRDLGLIAEEVAEVEPLLVTHNDKGVIEGVKYEQLNVVLINAVKELKTENEALKEQNAALAARLTALEQVMQKLLAPPLDQAAPPQRRLSAIKPTEQH